VPASQYRFHDLSRVFARERLAAEESAADRKAVLERALSAVLSLAEEELFSDSSDAFHMPHRALREDRSADAPPDGRGCPAGRRPCLCR